jgi:hypothetical protein
MADHGQLKTGQNGPVIMVAEYLTFGHKLAIQNPD